MTPKEALIIFYDRFEFSWGDTVADDVDILNEIANLFETLVDKATPMERLESYEHCTPAGVKHWVYKCPKCDDILFPRSNYCHKCGQALKWSDEK